MTQGLHIKGLHIIGAGGHAKVVVALAHTLGLNIEGIYDDRPLPLPDVLGHPVVGSVREVPDNAGIQAVIAIGNNAVRRAIVSQFHKLSWVTLVHPTAWVAPTSLLRSGTVVMAGAVIQPDVQVGEHVIVNTAAGIDHDCVIGSFSHLAPGARIAGNVTVNEGAFLGVGAVCIPGVDVGAWSTIGAGSTVVRSIPAEVTAVGSPATVIRRESRTP